MKSFPVMPTATTIALIALSQSRVDSANISATVVPRFCSFAFDSNEPVSRIAFDEELILEANTTRTASTEILNKRQIFQKLAAKWKAETGSQSITTLRYADRSYHSILALGKEAIPFILTELRREPDWWFEALRVLAEFTPVRAGMKFNEAVTAWINWGIQNGYIAREA